MGLEPQSFNTTREHLKLKNISWGVHSIWGQLKVKSELQRLLITIPVTAAIAHKVISLDPCSQQTALNPQI
jgi:hypothetical protein